MLLTEAQETINSLLRGDNSNPSVSVSAVNLALQDVLRYCQPASLIALWADTVTDMYRMIPTIAYDDEDLPIRRYLKEMVVTGDPAEDISPDPQLDLAVIYFICSLYSNKNKQLYRQMAIDICFTYDSSSLADPE